MSIDIGSMTEVTGGEYPGYTFVTQENPANEDGTITTVEIGVTAEMTGCRVGIFYVVNGDTLKCRDSVLIGNVPIGIQTFNDLSLSVMVGDYIGIYFETGYVNVDWSVTEINYWYAGGSHMTPGEEFGGSPYPGRIGLYGENLGEGLVRQPKFLLNFM